MGCGEREWGLGVRGEDAKKIVDKLFELAEEWGRSSLSWAGEF